MPPRLWKIHWPTIQFKLVHSTILVTATTRATSFTSGAMIDLLRGSLGDSRYSDNDSNRYQHSQYGLLSGNYLNERNSAFEAQAELSLPSPPLRSPFELHRDATSLDPNARSHNTSGTIAMSTQVSAYSAYPYCSRTDTYYPRVDTPQRDRARSVRRTKPGVYAPFHR